MLVNYQYSLQQKRHQIQIDVILPSSIKPNYVKNINFKKLRDILKFLKSKYKDIIWPSSIKKKCIKKNAFQKIARYTEMKNF